MRAGRREWALHKRVQVARPAPFSKAHRLWGTLGMVDMALTGATGVMLDVVGFAAGS